MKTVFVVAVCVFLYVGFAHVQKTQEHKSARRTWAPTYYVAVEGQLMDDEDVRFRGASNLPPGARISVAVTELVGAGWNDYSERLCVPVGETGLFGGEIRPKQHLKFRTNLIISAAFATNLCRQSSAVLDVVGKKGWYLSGVENADSHSDDLSALSNNPQLYQTSGWYYGLLDIARID